MIRPRRAQDEELLRMRHGQIAQQDLVGQREDGRVGADAERECDNGDGGKTGRLSEHANAIVQILPACLHKKFPAARANEFLGTFETAAL